MIYLLLIHFNSTGYIRVAVLHSHQLAVSAKQGTALKICAAVASRKGALHGFTTRECSHSPSCITDGMKCLLPPHRPAACTCHQLRIGDNPKSIVHNAQSFVAISVRNSCNEVIQVAKGHVALTNKDQYFDLGLPQPSETKVPGQTCRRLACPLFHQAHSAPKFMRILCWAQDLIDGMMYCAVSKIATSHSVKQGHFG